MAHEGGGAFSTRITGFFIIVVTIMVAAAFFAARFNGGVGPTSHTDVSSSSVPVVTPPQSPPAPGTPATPAGQSPATKLPTNIVPHRGATITSPVTVSGEAPGTWFFEGSFPVVVTDWDGKIIGTGHVTAQKNWMTAAYVPFAGTVSFTVDPQAPYHTGSIIFKKDNPSGLPQNDAALEVPVTFQ